MKNDDVVTKSYLDQTLDQRFDRFYQERIDPRFQWIEARFDRIDERFEAMEQKMDRHFDHLDALYRKDESRQQEYTVICGQLSGIEEKMKRIEEEMKSMNRRLEGVEIEQRGTQSELLFLKAWIREGMDKLEQRWAHFERKYLQNDEKNPHSAEIPCLKSQISDLQARVRLLENKDQ